MILVSDLLSYKFIFLKTDFLLIGFVLWGHYSFLYKQTLEMFRSNHHSQQNVTLIECCEKTPILSVSNNFMGWYYIHEPLPLMIWNHWMCILKVLEKHANAINF